MSLIKNLIKEPEKKKPRRNEEQSTENSSDGDEDKKPRFIVKSAMDLQRLKLEKLMKNPAKPVVLPEPRREKDYMNAVPQFVRNVMGSSAGAGSGEFHVYRHLRRKEYARQKTIKAVSLREKLDEEYQQKIENNRRAAQEKTAKKRAKRLKKKQRAKHSKTQDQKTKLAEPMNNSSDSDNVTDIETGEKAELTSVTENSHENDLEKNCEKTELHYESALTKENEVLNNSLDEKAETSE